MTALDDSLATAYLERLGVEARPNEVDAAMLATLQRAHIAAVPYESIDIARGAAPGIDPVAAARRIVAGRGGYCYHLNGGFALLLEWLGVEVTRHVAGVTGRTASEPSRPSGNHLGLTVAVGGTRWFVDVGLGDGPAEPLPLVAGSYAQDGWLYGLEPSPIAPGGWRFNHDENGSFVFADVALEQAVTADFAAMHVQLSTDPESGFVRIATVQRRVGTRLEVLRGCVFLERDGAAEQRRDIDSQDEWWSLVVDRFGLAYDDLSSAERADLWRKVRATHDAWDAAGRP